MTRNILNHLPMMRKVGKVSPWNAFLMTVYEDFLEASECARGIDFRSEKQKLVRTFRLNPLGPFFYILSDFLVTPSAEAIEMIRSKTRSQSSSPKTKARLIKSKEDDEEETISVDDFPAPEQCAPLDLGSSNPPATPAGNKRVLSGESYGQVSTETTPTKINHAEPLSQVLQNTLITTVINQVWLGGASIPWAQNRKIYLDYRP